VIGEDIAIVCRPTAHRSFSESLQLLTRKEELATLEARLTAENLNHWLSRLGEAHEIDVALPRFRLESKFELNEPLQSLGMVRAFDQRQADFSRMATRPPGFISHVTHKAFVEVNEEGTVAAAATAATVQLERLSSRRPIRADRPFVFLIGHNPSGSVLFMGRVTNPKG